jgi:hypothetical protein
MMKVDPKRGGKHMAIKGARGRRASFFSLGSDLDGDLAREPSLSINPAKKSHGV